MLSGEVLADVPCMNEGRTGRRGFSYSLRSSFVAVTAASVAFWWYGQPPLPFEVIGDISRADVKAIVRFLSCQPGQAFELAGGMENTEVAGWVFYFDDARREPILSMERKSAEQVEVRTGVQHPPTPGGGGTGEGYTTVLRNRNGHWHIDDCTRWMSAAYH